MAVSLVSTEKPVVIITGASSGIGLATAGYLAEKGYQVYAGVRSTSKLDGIESKIREIGSNLQMLIIDVTDNDTITAAVNTVLEKEGKIDALINNAAYALTGTVESCLEKEHIDLFNVNYFGPSRMIKAVLPSMRDKMKGRIINIGSVAGIASFPVIELYSASKAALRALSESMAVSLSPWHIHVSIIEPGSVKTPAAEKQPVGTQFPKEENPYAILHEKGDSMCKSNLSYGDEAIEVAQLIHRVLTAEKPDVFYPFGEFATMGAKERFTDPTGVKERERMIDFLTSSGVLPPPTAAAAGGAGVSSPS